MVFRNKTWWDKTFIFEAFLYPLIHKSKVREWFGFITSHAQWHRHKKPVLKHSRIPTLHFWFGFWTSTWIIWLMQCSFQDKSVRHPPIDSRAVRSWNSFLIDAVTQMRLLRGQKWNIIHEFNRDSLCDKEDEENQGAAQEKHKGCLRLGSCLTFTFLSQLFLGKAAISWLPPHVGFWH